MPIDAYANTFNWPLVTLSVLVVVFASYVALGAMDRLHATRGQPASHRWQLAFGLSLGSGVWSMHLIAMLAFELPVPVTYTTGPTLASWLLVVAFMALGARVLRLQQSPSMLNLATTGVIVGLGIAAMHYTGMAAVQTPTAMHLSPSVTALSVMVSITVATMAMLLLHAFHASKRQEVRLAVALVMGLAASSMHYLAMTGVTFARLASPTPDLFAPTLSPLWLAAAVVVLTTLIQGGVFAATLISRAQDMDRAIDPHGPALSPIRRLKLIVPSVMVLLVVVAAVTVAVSYFNTHNSSNRQIQRRLEAQHILAERIFEATQRLDAQALSALLQTITRNAALASAFAARDRDATEALALPLYEDIHRAFDVSNFSLILPNSEVFSRLHAPWHFGGRFEHGTLQQAQSKDNLHWGLEMDALGRLTLRAVAPWHDPQDGQLLGFIELGKEIDHILETIQQVSHMQGFTVLHKSALNQLAWQTGMITLGRKSPWDSYPEVLVTGEVLPGVQALLEQHALIHQDPPHEIKINERAMRPVTLRLRDMNGMEIGDLVLMADVTTEANMARTELMSLVVVVLLLGLPLLAFFVWQAKQLERNITQSEGVLRQRADMDALMPLLSRRRFDEVLPLEIERARRYQTPLSLLMLDIDHFKRVNDTYGHLVGDAVLRTLGGIIKSCIRTPDIAARYGGEEMVVILPESAGAAAQMVAKRIRHAVEQADMPFGTAQAGHITISIGVSSFPDLAEDARGLIHSADHALYRAKSSGRNRVCSDQTDTSSAH